MLVALVRYTPEPELTVAAAARVSSSPATVADIQEKLTPVAANRLLEQLISSGHLSPFEHVSFTFAIEGISRVTSHQLVRHRVASYTQQSQRYVAYKKLKYVTPPAISARPSFLARYRQVMQECYDLYGQMHQAGIPVEDARYVLPGAVETRLIMTMNARELMHASSLRLCLKAQWEIVELFEQIKTEVTKVAPFIGAELKAKCYGLGHCDEKTSCGLFPTQSSAATK